MQRRFSHPGGVWARPVGGFPSRAHRRQITPLRSAGSGALRWFLPEPPTAPEPGSRARVSTGDQLKLKVSLGVGVLEPAVVVTMTSTVPAGSTGDVATMM